MKIPTSVHGLAGPIRVRLVPDLKGEDGEALLGQWRPSSREILLNANSSVSAHTRLITLHHEEFHAFLTDSGVKVKRGVEQACDLYAAWQVGR